jgi:hypothetical protein
VIDQGGDHWTERIAEELQISCQRAEVRKLEYAAASADRPAAEADPAVHACVQQAMADWAQQLREAYEDCVGTIPPHRRPGRCVLFGRSARMPGLPALAAETLGVQAEPLLTDGLELAEGIDLGSSAPAIGAAMWAMAGDWPTVSLTGPSEDQLRRRGRFRGLQRRLLPVGRSSWRWAALIVWLLAAVAALYGLDKVEANRLEDTLRDFRAKTGGHAGQGAESANPQDNLARQLAIGTYLEMAGPTPLEVLDRISQIVPKQLLLTYWHYSRSGEVIIRGTAPNEKEFAAMLGKLCEVGEVEWKSGRPDKGKFRFEIHLQVGRSMKPTTQEAPEGEAAPSKPSPATQPATQPASRPAAEPASSPASAPAAERQGGGS